ncbi:MAG: M48 family metalloprotease [Stellaceae bacterium]
MRRILVVVVAALLLFAEQAHAQSIALLRDAEIEKDLKTFEMPVWKAAGLAPDALHIYLINDMRLNSFVAGGQNIFIYVGTILRAKTPNQLVGIMAHETGHIAGAHLARSLVGMRRAMYEGLAAMVASIGLAVLSGGIGAATIAGAASVPERAWRKYSVEQEARADQAAMYFLDKTHQSTRGLLQFFEILQQEEFLTGQQEIPYLMTHPLTSERIQYVRYHVAHSPYSNNRDPPAWTRMLKRMKAKLRGFLQDPDKTLSEYPLTDHSLPARYARAIAWYREPDLTKSVPAVDGLIRDYPKDPYFRELKGQMLFENGHVAAAVAPYEEAVKLDPNANLLRIELAQVQIETGNAALVTAARDNLERVTQFEVDNPEAWRLLAIAYGREHKIGLATLALAQESIATGDNKTARLQAMHAEKILPAGLLRQRALDIAAEAKRDQNNDH